MTENYLKIRISRLVPGKKLLFDFFIHFPRNKKMIRMLASGSDLDSETLERLLNKKIEHIYAPNTGLSNTDPETIVLQEEPQDMVEVLLPQTVQSAPESAPEQIVASAVPEEKLEETRFTPSPTEKEEHIKISGGKEKEDLTEMKFAASEKTPEEIQKFSSTPQQKLDEIKFSSEGREKETVQTIKGSSSSPSEEEELRFSNSSGEKPAEKTFRFSKNLEAIKVDPGLVLKSVDKRAELLKNIRGAFTIRKISKEINQLVKEGKAKSLGDRAEHIEKIQALKSLIQQIEESDGTIEDLPEGFSVDTEVQEITNLMDKNEDPAALLTLLSTQVERVEDFKNAALKNAAELEHSQRAMRDIPSTASRLATQLGHALGYNNTEFLCELALSAILYFSVNSKSSPEAQKLSPLFEKITTESIENMEDVVADAQEIIWMVDEYLNDPSCDRVNKEFDMPVFESALQNLFQKNSDVNIWNITKWKQSVESGITIDSHSLYSKVCAIAIKKHREVS